MSTHPTQVHRPWRATARTVFQAVIGLAAIWGLVVHTLGLPAWGWVPLSLAVAAGVTRVMALPGVEAWLQRFLPFLAADPGQKRDARGRFVKGEGGFLAFDLGCDCPDGKHALGTALWHRAYRRWHEHRDRGHEFRAAAWGWLADRLVRWA